MNTIPPWRKQVSCPKCLDSDEVVIFRGEQTQWVCRCGFMDLQLTWYEKPLWADPLELETS